METNTFNVGELTFEAIGDRILIQEDAFRSGYECDSCHGSGKSTLVPGARCAACEGTGVVKGGLAIPETSERRPTSGTIVSAGPTCKWLKCGDSVLYSNFAGYVVDLDRAGQPVTIRILHETEVLAKMSGHLELRSLRGKSEIATYQP